MPQPYKLFTIYAREDAQYLEELRGQLRPLEIAGRIKMWSDREINPGVDWEKEIVHNLDNADIILILVSAAYYNSAYIHEKEIKYAITRHERGQAKVLPVIVRPCHFLDDPVISHLQVLPTDGKPVTDRRHWQERDDAWLDVVAGVKRTIDIIREAENRTEQEIRDAAERERLAAEQKKADEQRARQAELDARERAERERREAEQRTREEQARYEREAKERAENERLAELRREQEQQARRAEQTAWQQAADDHDITAYENYLARYPQGEYAREARARIKELRKKEAAPLPLKRYAAIGAAALALVLSLWLIFGGEKEQTAQNQLSQSDTTQLSQNSSAKDPDPSPNQTTEGSKTISPSSLPENVTVGKPKEEKPRKEESAQPPPVTRSRKSGFEMVRVQGGAFTMGSPTNEEGRYDDECQHTVTVHSFSIGKYEVTQADWREIMGNNPSNFKNCDDCPVERVSWNDIQDFLKKLNARYPGKNYRLPTEEEWEYAARGGKAASSMTKLYAGSNTPGNVAWYSENSNSKTHPVGGKTSNELGLYDMSGNVWEWCSDTYKLYPCDTKNTAEGRSRVFRGGSWSGSAPSCRAANRSYFEAAYRNYNLGFRLCSFSLQ